MSCIRLNSDNSSPPLCPEHAVPWSGVSPGQSGSPFPAVSPPVHPKLLPRAAAKAARPRLCKPRSAAAAETSPHFHPALSTDPNQPRGRKSTLPQPNLHSHQADTKLQPSTSWLNSGNTTHPKSPF